ncbi:MAG: hypothetical protein U1D55_11230 [Phycisphaerae bacterium]
MSTQPNQPATTTVPPQWQRLLDAAQALLEARARQMVTMQEWRALRDAVLACRPGTGTPSFVAGRECPACHEWNPDLLIWRDEETVACQTCGNLYDPEAT